MSEIKTIKERVYIYIYLFELFPFFCYFVILQGHDIRQKDIRLRHTLRCRPQCLQLVEWELVLSVISVMFHKFWPGIGKHGEVKALIRSRNCKHF